MDAGKNEEKERKARILTVCSILELKVFTLSILFLTHLEADHYEVTQCRENAPKVVSPLKGHKRKCYMTISDGKCNMMDV